MSDAPGTGFGDFLAARRRFLARLRADTEITRLEAAWNEPTHVTEKADESPPGTSRGQSDPGDGGDAS